jgi:hypothetical protein
VSKESSDGRFLVEAALITVGGGSLIMWSWSVSEDAGGIIVGGLLVYSFCWQWFRGRDYELAPSMGRLMWLAVLAAAMVALFLYGR